EKKAIEKDYIEEIKRDVKNRPLSKYENPGFYNLMLDYMNEIKKSADNRYVVEPPEIPPIGTISIPSINAYTICIRSLQECFLIFPLEFFTFANLICKSVVHAIPYYEENGQIIFVTDIESIYNNILTDPELLNKFQEVLFAYLLHHFPSYAKPYILDEPYLSQASTLLVSMEQFICGHEFTHLSIKNNQKKGVNKIDHPDVDVLEYPETEEIVADQNGLILMMDVAVRNNENILLSYCGADLYFSCIDIIERGINVLKTGTDDGATLLNMFKDDKYRSPIGLDAAHPPAFRRRELLRTYLKEITTEEDYKQFIDLAKLYENIIEYYWMNIRSYLKIEHLKRTNLF
ncbi:MAG: hypothetical protein LLF83_08155, partial [Methanobacterium sp.]|nr:hypothetical protein [Methanobacterium sp.]